MKTVTGFTGSSIWKYVAMCPPASQQMVDAGYEDLANRFNPIVDVFGEVGVRFAHEVHPSEIAYDYWTTVRTLEAIGRREAFGLNWDPSHMVWQDVAPVSFLWDFRDRIYNVHVKDTKERMSNGRNGRLGSTWLGPIRAAVGTSSRQDTVTCRGRTHSACSTPSMTRVRSPSSGRRRNGPYDGRARGSRVREAPRLRPTGRRRRRSIQHQVNTGRPKRP